MIQSTVLLLFLFHGFVKSWWCTGHMLVAQIALNNINDSSSDMCNELVLIMQEFTISSTFVTSACWADDIQATDVRSFENWHFINQVWTNGTNVTHPTISPDNVVTEIKRIMDSLISSESSIWAKAMLFRFLVHFVGDIHQPLHCISLYDHRFPKGDQGGNAFIVFFQNMSKLHAIWDSGIGLYANDFERPLSSLRALELKNLATNITNEYPEDYFNGSSKILDPNVWKIEGYNKAIKYAYSNLVNGTTLEENSPYVRNATIQVRQQIALAGYRLANLIKTIPIISIRNKLSNAQIAGIGISIFFVGLIIGGTIAYIVVRLKRREYKVIN